MLNCRIGARPGRRAVLKGTGAFAVGLAFLPRLALSEEEKKLNFYNWAAR
jgi:hypothetical protein